MVGDDQAVAIQDLAGLLALVQAGVLEIHPWGSTLPNPERPDRIVFDLDPGEGVGWDAVVQGAVDVRDHLQGLHLESFVKTSGGKGLHVVVPIRPTASWDDAKAFAAGVAAAMTKASPALYTDTMAKRARTGGSSSTICAMGGVRPQSQPTRPGPGQGLRSPRPCHGMSCRQSAAALSIVSVILRPVYLTSTAIPGAISIGWIRN
jgi:hypothetical protein